MGESRLLLSPRSPWGFWVCAWWESWQVTMIGIMGGGKAGMGQFGVGWGWLVVSVGLKVGLGVALARSLRSGAESRLGKGLAVGIRVQAAASLGQAAAASATGQWAAGGWPACLPSAAGQLPRLQPLRPPSRWPRSCPAYHSPAPSAPPGPSGDRKNRGRDKRAREGGVAGRGSGIVAKETLSLATRGLAGLVSTLS